MQRIKPDVKHISTTDFPRTAHTPQFGVRKALMRSFNYARQYPEKMESLKAHIDFLQQKILEWEEASVDAEVFNGGQRAPLISGSNNRAALTTNDQGGLNPSLQLKPSDVNQTYTERNGPVSSPVKQEPALSVRSEDLPNRPTMPQMNPLKPSYGEPTATTVEPEAIEQLETEQVAPLQPLQPLQALAPIAHVQEPAATAQVQPTLAPLAPIVPQNVQS